MYSLLKNTAVTPRAGGGDRLLHNDANKFYNWIYYTEPIFTQTESLLFVHICLNYIHYWNLHFSTGILGL